MNRPFAPSLAKPLPRGPEHYWRLMQAAGARGFLVGELVGQCNGRSYRTLHLYVLALRDIGAVIEAARQPARQPGAHDAIRYVVARALRSAPVIRRESYTGRRGRVQEQLWTAMRALPQFSVAELAAVASTEEVAVKPMVASRYVKRLFRAGLLLAVVRPDKSSPGRAPGARAGIYRLRPSANRGPRPPAVIGDRVYDFNAGMFVGGSIDGSDVQVDEVAA